MKDIMIDIGYGIAEILLGGILYILCIINIPMTIAYLVLTEGFGIKISFNNNKEMSKKQMITLLSVSSIFSVCLIYTFNSIFRG